jgi:hypothetical protein
MVNKLCEKVIKNKMVLAVLLKFFPVKGLPQNYQQLINNSRCWKTIVGRKLNCSYYLFVGVMEKADSSR